MFKTVSIKPILDVQEDALEVDLADESNTEISLDLSSDSDGSANFQDAMSLEDELAAIASNPNTQPCHLGGGAFSFSETLHDSLGSVTIRTERE